MDNKDMVIVLVALLAVIFAFFYMSCKKGSTKEGFMGLSTPGRVAVEQVATNSKGIAFASVPSWQANLSPRFMPNSYGSYIQYNMPSQDMLAVPQDPLGYAEMVKAELGEAKPASTLPKYQDVKEMLPTADMKSGSGLRAQTYNWNRLMKVGLAKSKAQNNADFIRGDLPIPKVNTGWFSSRYGTEALRSGAMSVLGGSNNETSNALYSYMRNASGDTKTTFGGTALNMATGKTMGTSEGIGQGSLNITMFP